MRVLCFGDSITQGFWSVEGGWAERLRKHYDGLALKDLRNNNQPEIFNLGVSGDVTEGVKKRFKHELDARRWRWPDEKFCLVFAIGINDTIVENGQERSSVEKYRQGLKDLMSGAKAETDKIMFIGLTPVDESTANNRPGKPKEYDNERIVSFDKALEQVCREESVHYVSLFEPLKAKISEDEQLFDDGLHPNDAGHQLIFELVRPELDRILNS
jgi:lysophospholipase L1-like esterase